MGKQLKQQNKKGKQQLQQQDKKGSPPPPTPSPEVCGACCAPRQAAVLGPLVGSSECALLRCPPGEGPPHATQEVRMAPPLAPATAAAAVQETGMGARSFGSRGWAPVQWAPKRVQADAVVDLAQAMDSERRAEKMWGRKTELLGKTSISNIKPDYAAGLLFCVLRLTGQPRWTVSEREARAVRLAFRRDVRGLTVGDCDV